MLINSLLFIIGLMAVNALPLKRQQATKLGGVNLAGCEFGMTTEGGSGSYYCPGTDQITHFTSKGANLFRLPFGWQYMVGNNQASTSFDPTFLGKYDTLVQGVLKSGGYAMLDLHNYARWNGGIVGQGGPSNENLASVWSLLAKKYANEPKVIFGIMNEPHDLDTAKWATTAQASVNAIRAAGAKTQMIALPGTFYQHPEAYTDGRNDPILKVTDPAASDNSLLILDIHQYLDGDGSGQSRECTTNGVAKLTAVTNLFKTTGRKAFLSETGGGNTASCQKALGEELKYVKDNSDTWLGFAVWSAGSFDSSYELSITPQGGVDNDLFKLAVQPNLPGSSGATPVTTSASASKASSVVSSTRASSSAVNTSVRPSTSSARPASSAIISSSVRSSAIASSTIRPSSADALSSKAIMPSSSRPVSSSSVRPISSSTSRPASSVQSSAKPSTSITAPSTTGNFQTYKGAAGGITAPAVTKSGNQYVTGGNNFNTLSDALQRSCYTQMNDCQNAANKGRNKGGLTVQACADQLPACLAVAGAA